MTWSAVQSWLESLTFTATTNARALSTFAYDKKATRDQLPRARAWWTEVTAISSQRRQSHSGVYRQRVTLDLCVHYPHDVATGTQQSVILEDYTSIVQTLSDPAQWGRPASTVVALSYQGEPLYPATLESVDKNKLLVIQITIDHEVTP